MLELDFCAWAAGLANEIFQSDSASPFAAARIEGRGSGDQRRKRKDLRFYDKNGKIAITGEVRMPGPAAAPATTSRFSTQAKKFIRIHVLMDNRTTGRISAIYGAFAKCLKLTHIDSC